LFLFLLIDIIFENLLDFLFVGDCAINMLEDLMGLDSKNLLVLVYLELVLSRIVALRSLILTVSFRRCKYIKILSFIF